MGMDDQRHALTSLPQGIARYQLWGRLGGFQGRSGRVRKISFPSGFDSWIVQPVAISYPGLFIFDRHNLNSKSTWYNLCKERFIRYPSLGRNRNNVYKIELFFFENLGISVAQPSKNAFISCWESMLIFCPMRSYRKASYILIAGVCQIRFNNSLSFVMFYWPCNVIYPYNMNQQDPLFSINLLQ